MYVVVVEFELDPGGQLAFMLAVLEQARQSLSGEADCQQFDVCVSPDQTENQRVLLYERYTSRAAFEAHLASAHYAAFDAAVRPLVIRKTVSLWAMAE